MPFPVMPDPAADREREQDRRHPERETLELAAAGAAKVLGHDHGVTMAFAKAARAMAPGVRGAQHGGQDATPGPAQGDCRGGRSVLTR